MAFILLRHSVYSSLNVSCYLNCSLFLPSWFIIAKRKQAFAYNDNYLELGFTLVVVND